MKRFTTLLFTAILALSVFTAHATLTTPGNLSPANGATNQSADALLNWGNVNQANAYQYKVSTDPTLTGAVAVQVSVSQANCANLMFGTTYYWSVRAIKTGTNPDSSAWTSIRNFTTVNIVTLTSPANGANGQAPNANLTWNAITGVTNYDVQYDTTAGFTSPLNYYFSVAGTSPNANGSNLLFGTTYYWKARARHSLDTTLWSNVRNFIVLDEVLPVLPANGATNVSLTPTVKWVSVAGSTGYQYRYSTHSNMSNPVLMNMIGTTVMDTLSGLTYGTTYYWQIRVFHSQDTSNWSAAWSFTTLYQLNSAPVLVSPSNNSTNIALPTVNFTWNASTGATSYEYEYADNSSFNNSVYGTASSLSHISGTLLATTTYYWRVRGSNGNGYSPWSSTWNFKTIVQFLTAPTLVSPADLTVNVPLSGATMTWNPIYGATQYYYEFDTHWNFTGPTGGTVAGTSAITGPISTNTTYFWRIKGGDGSIWSPWSSAWRFSTGSVIVGVEEETAATTAAYPNPCKGSFTLNTGITNETSIVTVYDLCGRIVYRNEAMTGTENQVNLGSVKAGSYMLSVENSAGRKSMPLIVE